MFETRLIIPQITHAIIQEWLAQLNDLLESAKAAGQPYLDEFKRFNDLKERELRIREAEQNRPRKKGWFR